MDWFKKHADTIVILGSFALCFWTMNEKMKEGFNTLRAETQKNLSSIDHRLTIIETVLVKKNILPPEIAKNEKNFNEQ